MHLRRQTPRPTRALTSRCVQEEEGGRDCRNRGSALFADATGRTRASEMSRALCMLVAATVLASARAFAPGAPFQAQDLYSHGVSWFLTREATSGANMFKTLSERVFPSVDQRTRRLWPVLLAWVSAEDNGDRKKLSIHTVLSPNFKHWDTTNDLAPWPQQCDRERGLSMGDSGSLGCQSRIGLSPSQGKLCLSCPCTTKGSKA